MLVQVTQEDINQGLRDDCTRCPVALAVLRAADASIGWEVTNSMVWRYIDGDWYGYHLPYEAKVFIASFDSMLPVKPFSFELEV